MRKLAFVFIVMACTPFALAVPTGPAYVVNTGGTAYYPSGAGEGGGAFSFTAVSGPWSDVYCDSTHTYAGVPGFQTFCVETEQNIYLSTNYYASIDDTVYWDGSAKLLSSGDYNHVRQVYATYYRAGGGDAGLTALGLATEASGNITLQTYIWEKLGYTLPGGWSPLDASVVASLDSITSPYAGHVMALNLWSTSDSQYWDSAHDLQSQLIYIDQIIPAPAAALLGVLGLGLVGWIKRRLS